MWKKSGIKLVLDYVALPTTAVVAIIIIVPWHNIATEEISGSMSSD